MRRPCLLGLVPTIFRSSSLCLTCTRSSNMGMPAHPTIQGRADDVELCQLWCIEMLLVKHAEVRKRDKATSVHRLQHFSLSLLNASYIDFDAHATTVTSSPVLAGRRLWPRRTS
ncbi:hypothetical protein B0J12DRAFT_699078 [Macrophomina phaseolina]|uniref:Secreted protein n=1 Tax=Macrophomina phaseolina TaxID=35725 RepID=A0ABQ8GE50_9PEZI|nr:hypothetical protein B0J12DRAFT_699078 [Macrophomina phaseolina]